VVWSEEEDQESEDSAIISFLMIIIYFKQSVVFVVYYPSPVKLEQPRLRGHPAFPLLLSFHIFGSLLRLSFAMKVDLHSLNYQLVTFLAGLVGGFLGKFVHPD